MPFVFSLSPHHIRPERYLRSGSKEQAPLALCLFSASESTPVWLPENLPFVSRLHRGSDGLFRPTSHPQAKTPLVCLSISAFRLLRGVKGPAFSRWIEGCPSPSSGQQAVAEVLLGSGSAQSCAGQASITPSAGWDGFRDGSKLHVSDGWAGSAPPSKRQASRKASHTS